MTQKKIVPQAGEVFYAEINDDHPFARRNVGELLNERGTLESISLECDDGEVRHFLTISPDSFHILLQKAKALRDQYTLWHTTTKTLKPVRYDLTPTTYYVAPPEGCSGVVGVLMREKRLQKVTIAPDKGKHPLTALTTVDLKVADRVVDTLFDECTEEEQGRFRFFKAKNGPLAECNRAFEKIQGK